MVCESLRWSRKLGQLTSFDFDVVAVSVILLIYGVDLVFFKYFLSLFMYLEVLYF